MNTSSFIGTTIWFSILLIIFGVLTGFFKNDFITWFFFAFLCVTGVLKVSLERPVKK